MNNVSIYLLNYLMLLLIKKERYIIDYGFDSPGYENEFLALAYLDENNTLQLETVVLECF